MSPFTIEYRSGDPGAPRSEFYCLNSEWFFPKKGTFPWFAGPNRTFGGHVLRLNDNDKKFFPEEVLNLGDTYLRLFFVPLEKTVPLKVYSERKRGFKEGGEDYLSILNSLESDPRLMDASFLVGRTNTEMACFAVDRLGFKFFEPNTPDPFWWWVYAPKQQLLDAQIKIKSALTPLLRKA